MTNKVITHPKNYEEFKSQLRVEETFDNSALNTWMECRRKYFHRHELALTTEEEALPLAYGSAWHEAMYHYYRGDSLDDCLKAFIMRCCRPGSSIPKELDISEGSEQQYSIEWGMHLLQNYFKNHPRETEQFITETDPEGNPYLELGFAIDIANAGIFVGRIDRIARNKDTGRLWVIDYKTTKMKLSKTYTSQFNPNNQVTSYCWALQELTGELPEGFLVDVTRVYQFKSMSPDLSELFVKVPTMRNQNQIDWRKKEVAETIKDIKSARERGIHAYYKNAPNACTMWGGCMFLPICKANDAGTAQMIAHANYKQEVWHPYDTELDLGSAKQFNIIKIEAEEILEELTKK